MTRPWLRADHATAAEAEHAHGAPAVRVPGDQTHLEVVLAGGPDEHQAPDPMAAHALDPAATDVGVDPHDPAVARLANADRKTSPPDARTALGAGPGPGASPNAGARRPGGRARRLLEVVELHGRHVGGR